MDFGVVLFFACTIIVQTSVILSLTLLRRRINEYEGMWREQVKFNAEVIRLLSSGKRNA